MELLTLTHYNFIRNGTLKVRFTTKLNQLPQPKVAALSIVDGWLMAEYSWLVPDIEDKLNRFDYSGRRVKTFVSDKFYSNQQGTCCLRVVCVVCVVSQDLKRTINHLYQSLQDADGEDRVTSEE